MPPLPAGAMDGVPRSSGVIPNSPRKGKSLQDVCPRKKLQEGGQSPSERDVGEGSWLWEPSGCFSYGHRVSRWQRPQYLLWLPLWREAGGPWSGKGLGCRHFPLNLSKQLSVAVTEVNNH